MVEEAGTEDGKQSVLNWRYKGDDNVVIVHAEMVVEVVKLDNEIVDNEYEAEGSLIVI